MHGGCLSWEHIQVQKYKNIQKYKNTFNKYIQVMHGGCLSWEQTHFWMLRERELSATAIYIEI